MLAMEVAKALDRPLLQWHVKSTSKAQQGLYEYDAVSRLRDSQWATAALAISQLQFVRGPVWDAFDSDRQTVLFDRRGGQGRHRVPNDLLR